MSQTSYTTDFQKGFAGELGTNGDHDIESFTNSLGAAMPFGVAVVRSATEEAVLPTAADDAILGLVVHSHAFDNPGLAASDGVPDEERMSVLRRGSVFGLPEDAVVQGDPVYVRIVATGNEQLGALRATMDGTDTVRLKGARWDADGDAGVATLVKLDGTQESPEEPFLVDVDHPAVTADDLGNYILEVPADRWLKIERVTLYNETGLAGDGTNFFAIRVEDEVPTTYAEHSTDSGEEGTITADTPTDVAVENSGLVPPGSRLNLDLEEGGAATLPVGKIQLVARYL